MCRRGRGCAAIGAGEALEEFADKRLTGGSPHASVEDAENAFARFEGGRVNFDQVRVKRSLGAGPELRGIIAAFEAKLAIGDKFYKQTSCEDDNGRFDDVPSPS